MKSREEIETAHRIFEAFVRYIKTFPGVRFRTARAARALFPDGAYERSFSPDELRELARWVRDNELTYFEDSAYTLSAAEIFRLLVSFGTDLAAGRETESYRLGREIIMGPVRPAPQPGLKVSPDQFLRTLADVEAFMGKNARVPDDIWLGSHSVSPESFLRALAVRIPSIASPGGAEVAFEPAHLSCAEKVGTDRSLWGWVIFADDFDAPEMMDLARRQAWTLKPAIGLSTQ